MSRPQNAEELFRMAVGCKTCETWNQASARELVADAPARSHRPADAQRHPTPRRTTRAVAAL